MNVSKDVLALKFNNIVDKNRDECLKFCGYEEWVFEGKHTNATVVL